MAEQPPTAAVRAEFQLLLDLVEKADRLIPDARRGTMADPEDLEAYDNARAALGDHEMKKLKKFKVGDRVRYTIGNPWYGTDQDFGRRPRPGGLGR